MAECRYHGKCRIEYDTDFDVCFPCMGEGAETCLHYKPLPDRDALLALADEMDSASCDLVTGEMSVGLFTVWGWAQEIREACGVTCS